MSPTAFNSNRRHTIRCPLLSQAAKVIGESTVGYKNRITLVGQLPRILRVREGDKVVFLTDEKGNVLLKNAKDVKISIEY